MVVRTHQGARVPGGLATAFPLYLVRRNQLLPDHRHTSLVNQTLQGAFRARRLGRCCHCLAPACLLLTGRTATREPGREGCVSITLHPQQVCAKGGKEGRSLRAPPGDITVSEALPKDIGVAVCP